MADTPTRSDGGGYLAHHTCSVIGHLRRLDISRAKAMSIPKRQRDFNLFRAKICRDIEDDAWNRQWDGLDGGKNSDAATNLLVWCFYRAASLHRTYMLRDLLPKHDLIVD